MADLLSARAAATLCGVSERTIRRWVLSGRLAADKHDGTFRISRSALEPFVGHADTSANAAAPAAAAADTSAAVTALSAHVADLREQLATKDQQISELHTLLAQAQHALPAPDTRVGFTSGPPANGVHETPVAPPESKRPWWRLW